MTETKSRFSIFTSGLFRRNRSSKKTPETKTTPEVEDDQHEKSTDTANKNRDAKKTKTEAAQDLKAPKDSKKKHDTKATPTPHIAQGNSRSSENPDTKTIFQPEAASGSSRSTDNKTNLAAKKTTEATAYHGKTSGAKTEAAHGNSRSSDGRKTPDIKKGAEAAHGNSRCSDGRKTPDKKKIADAERGNSRSPDSTPVRPSSALSGRMSNSTPRQRPLSMHVPRAMSMRVSKKEKRWSMRLEEPTSPVTTYQDDFQSPGAMSLLSLDLETSPAVSAGGGADPNDSGTTYRESFQWPSDKRVSCAALPTDTANDRKQGREKHGSAGDNSRGYMRKLHAVSEKTRPGAMTPLSLCTQTVAAPNGPSPQPNVAKSNQSGSVASVLSPAPLSQTPQTAGHRAFSRRNRSSFSFGTGHSVPSRPSSALYGQDIVTSAARRPNSTLYGPDSVSFRRQKQNVAATPDNGEKVRVASRPLSAIHSRSSGVADLLSGSGYQPRGLANGVTVGVGVGSGVDGKPRTAQRPSSNQHQSSHGGSPFVYGSGSGYWV